MHPEKLHILLAEDDEDDRLLFLNVFNKVKINHKLNICEDGVDLMNYLNVPGNKPHILFLDLAMPGKPGMECLREIRKNRELDDVTVAIYSSTSAPANVEQAFILGANVYIKKPNDFESLEKALTDIIYLNWQYITDGLNKENFMISY